MAILLLSGCLMYCVRAGAALKPADFSENSLPPYASSLPFELHPGVDRASFHLSRPGWRAIYSAIAEAYGIRFLYDKDLGEPRLSSDFQVENVTLQQALEVAGNISKTFVAPVDEHTGIVSADTPQKRSEYERQILGNFQADDQTTAQQLTEISTALRLLLELRRVSQDNRSNWISVLGRTRQVALARQFVRSLQKDRGEVMVDVDILEIDSQRARALGILPPQPFQLLSLGQSGVLPTVPVLTFGSGRTLYGVTLPGATVSLTFSSSVVRSVQQLQLRASDGQEASLLAGERYPLLIGSVSSSIPAQQNSPGLSQGSTSNTLSITVAASAAGPSISSITTSPNPPVIAQQFSFTISGSGFDPSTAEVLFTGSGCSPCTIPNNLLSVTATSITGPATLNAAGNYSVTVQSNTGSLSNSVNLTVSTAGLSISSITTSPNPPVIGQPFSFLIGGNGFDPLTAEVLFTGPGCSPCTVPNGALIVTGASATGPATLNGSGIYTVVVQNISGPPSNTVSITVATSAAGPSISSITTLPDPPVTGQQFTFTISGSGFDPSSAQVLLTGPACLPCVITAGQLSVSSASITGLTTLMTAGSYTVSVQNSFGLPSNTLSVTVSAVGLSISSFTTSPNPPVAGQQFGFTVTGDGFDPSNAQVVFTGSGCLPCTVPYGALSVTTTGITGTATLNTGGNYSVAVLNGSVTATTSSIPSLNPSAIPGFYPSIQYEDLGVKVKATPYMHAGRELTLKFDLSLRNLGTQSLNGNPIISNRQVAGQVRLRDGENYLISGILTREEDTSVNGYPWLSRLPLLGVLFGSRNKQHSQTELVMLISPHIVRQSPAEEVAFGPIYFGKELQGLPPEPTPPPAPVQQPPPVPPVPGVPQQQPGVPPQPGVALQPGVAPQPGAPGTPLPGTPPGLVQPIPAGPGGQPQTNPPQSNLPPGLFPPGVVPQGPSQPAQP